MLEPTFDFNSPENVIIEVIGSEDDWLIEDCKIINPTDGVIGAASYENEFGGFLDYVIKDMIDFPGEGCFVVEGITGTYTRGDGWMTDDDMSFDYSTVRPATETEIASL